VKYKNFRTVARVFGILAWLAGIVVLLINLGIGFITGGVYVVIYIIIGIVGGFFSFASLYAFSQFIYVLLDIERNTRATLRALLEEIEPEEEVESEQKSETDEGE
jgi:hypothetical protein